MPWLRNIELLKGSQNAMESGGLVVLPREGG